MRVIRIRGHGETGIHVCREALDQGHEVTAFTRSAGKVKERTSDFRSATGECKAGNEGKVGKINREDVARFLVQQVDDADYSRQAISVTG